MARTDNTTPSKRGTLHVKVEERLLLQVKREAADRRIPLRAIIEAALAERYDPEHAKSQETLVIKELRALRNEVRQVNFGNRVLTELTTLTTKNLFQRLPSPTDDSRAAGTGFYNALIAAVEKVFTQDTPLLDKFAASLMVASEAEFDALAEATEHAQDRKS